MRRLGPILSYLILLWSQIKADHEQCESISPTVVSCRGFLQEIHACLANRCVNSLSVCCLGPNFVIV